MESNNSFLHLYQNYKYEKKGNKIYKTDMNFNRIQVKLDSNKEETKKKKRKKKVLQNEETKWMIFGFDDFQR